MLILYFPPFPADDEGVMLDQAVVGITAYAEDLVGIPEDALGKGWRTVRREHKVGRWPTIAAILDACGGSQTGSGMRNGRRDATDAEKARQQSLYGNVWIHRISEDEARHHRRQEEDLAAARIKRTELRPYLPRVAA